MTVEADEQSLDKTSPPSEAPVLLILLGASNLARGCFALGRHIQACLHPRPVEVMIATGPGRGYCVPGGLLTAVYPPIQSSRIFEAAREKSASGYRVIALVTDIGNDIMYGVSPETLIETVRRVFTRLHSMNAEIFFTTLPEKFEKGFSPAWFYILRTLLVPGSRVPYEKAIAGIIEVNRFLKESAQGSCHGIPGLDRYLGFDEIHYGWFSAHKAWTHVAGAMLEVMGLSDIKKITFQEMLKSYWVDLLKLVFSDFTGLIKNKPNIY